MESGHAHVCDRSRARKGGLLQCGWYLCSAPAAILDAFLCLEEKGIVKPGESKKGLEMGILVPTGPSIKVIRRTFGPGRSGCSRSLEHGTTVGTLLAAHGSLYEYIVTILKQYSTLPPRNRPAFALRAAQMHAKPRWEIHRVRSSDTLDTLCIRPSSRYTGYTSHM